MARSRTAVVSAARIAATAKAAIAARLAAITRATCKSPDSVCTGADPSESRHASSDLGNLFLSDNALVGGELMRGLRLKRVGSAKKHTDFTERHHDSGNKFENSYRTNG